MNQTENALLLSVHQNFFTEGKYHGAQVFYAKRPAVRRWPSSCRPIWPWASSRATAVSAKIGRRVSHGAYRLHRRVGRMRILSNYEEEQRLLQPEYQKKLAAVIAGTLSVWLSEEHPNEI